MQLMVLGMHRSGTSVLARILNLMGAYFGPEGASTGANRENPKGFWERRDVRDLNDMVLRSTGCDWNRIVDFDVAAVPPTAREEFNKHAGHLVLAMDANRPWFLKEPRICLLFPLWRTLLEVPVCIHIFRHPVEVAASLRTRNGIPIAAGLALWERYVVDALSASNGLPQLVVSHRELIEDPRGVTTRLVVQLREIGVTDLREPTARELDAFVRLELYREREGRPDLAPYAIAPQVQLFERLLEGGDLSELRLHGISARSKQALIDYEASLPPLEIPSRPKPPMPEPERVLREQLAVRTRELELAREQARESSKVSQEREASLGRIATLEAAVRSAQDDSARLVEEIDRVKEERARLQSRVKDLASDLESAENATVALGAQLADRFAEIETLTRLLMKSEDAAASAHARALELEADVRAASSLARKLRGECDTLRGQLAIATFAAAGLGRRADTLSAQLAAAHADIGWRIAAPWRLLRSGSRGADIAGFTGEDLNTIRHCELFDVDWYVEQYPDVAQGGVDPAMHYLLYGAYEGRDPGPRFDTRYYLSRNADVAESGMNPLLHYIWHGKREGRQTMDGGQR